MVLAPLVGLLLGAVVLVLLWVLGGGTLLLLGPAGQAGPPTASLSPLIAAAMRSRCSRCSPAAMHLDGLADTADGLGSGRDRDRALEVMRRATSGRSGW